MEVVTVPVLKDNFAYLLVCSSTKKAAAVDPAEPDKVIAAAKDLGVTISAVLTTHHHWDHAGGNVEIAKRLGDVPVYGEENTAGRTHEAVEGTTIAVGDLSVLTRCTPCHTRGHVLYYVEANGESAVFTGDTMFIGGCGHFFEGTPAEMHYALNTVVAGLPPQTRCYVGHEYTESNLKFAQYLEPENEAITKKLKWVRETLQAGGHTTPSTVAEELSFNPFMRVAQPTVQKALGMDGSDLAAVIGKVRSTKTGWKPAL